MILRHHCIRSNTIAMILFCHIEKGNKSIFKFQAKIWKKNNYYFLLQILQSNEKPVWCLLFCNLWPEKLKSYFYWPCVVADIDGLGSHEKGSQFLSSCCPANTGEGEESDVFEKDKFVTSGGYPFFFKGERLWNTVYVEDWLVIHPLQHNIQKKIYIKLSKQLIDKLCENLNLVPRVKVFNIEI